MEPVSTSSWLWAVARALIAVLRWLVSPIWGWISRQLFMEAYRVSSYWRICRDRELLCRRPLANGLCYSVCWQPYLLGQKQNHATIWLRSAGAIRFRSAKVVVTGIGDEHQLQAVVDIFDISEKATSCSVSILPIRHYYSGAYHTVRIELIALTDSKGSSVDLGSHRVQYLHPMDNLEAVFGLRQSDVIRWGRWWNLDFFHTEMHEYALRYRGDDLDAYLLGHARSPKQWLMSRATRWGFGLRCVFWWENLFDARLLKAKMALENVDTKR
jgi:hypothetical protein